MRLEKLKLAGFKSFVEPTTIHFPSNLVGVAGPNGCGKSNIIDAIRWVMGESSARHLRGESMTDVIFSGSKHRKPLGQASVELVFSNTHSLLGGAYANYRELSVKRSVSRDGQAVYTINGTRCRKRDVAEIFLGTGLGPRSYAIISQGTIAQIIESKPDELRLFFEEAAGISKYKLRKRETGQRMADCQENLQRVGDLRDALADQVAKLKRQAAAAEKYQALLTEQRQHQQQLLGLQWQALSQSLEVAKNKVEKQRQAKLELNQQVTEGAETLQSQRQKIDELNQTLSEKQAYFFEQKQAVATLQQQQAQAAAESKRISVELENKHLQQTQLAQQFSQDKVALEDCAALMETLKPKLDHSVSQVQAVEAQLASAQQQLSAQQQEVEAIEREMAAFAQATTVEQTKQQAWSATEAQSQQRLQSLVQESEQSQKAIDEADGLSDQQSSMALLAQRMERHKHTLEEDSQKLKEQRVTLVACEQRCHQLRVALASVTAQQASLMKSQEVALNKDGKLPEDWLSQHGLSHAQRFGELIKVAPGFERALEVVLSALLGAIPTPTQISDYLAGIDIVTTPLIAHLTAHEYGDKASVVLTTGIGLPLLIEKIDSPSPVLQTLLAGIHVAETLEDALHWLPQLSAASSIITCQGTWMSQYWWRPWISDSDEGVESVLARQRQLRQLGEDKNRLDNDFADAEQALMSCQSEIERLEAAKNEHYTVLTTTQSEYSEAKTAFRLAENQLAQSRQRLQSLQSQMVEEQQAQASRRQMLEESSQRVLALEEQQQTATQRHQALVTKRSQMSVDLASLQASRDQANEARREHELQWRTLETQQHSLQQVLERDSTQQCNLEAQLALLQKAQSQLAAHDTEALAAQLAQALEAKAQAQQQMTSVGDLLQQTRQEIDTCERAHRQQEKTLADMQQRLEQQQLDLQSLSIKQQHIEENYNNTSPTLPLATLVDELPESLLEAELSASLTTLGQKIQRLGAINLAAIEEYQIELEKKTQLDQQVEDLEKALAMLEQAMSTIDEETCRRFKDTFEQVSDAFERLFPKLFGGGSARLVLTSDNLLEAGVDVMARPPGKRNTNIYLLSGGEKALTAVALVFAIFQLNPSPFCLLDEVDAPLDDANVGRFCQLVETMSSQVQFIFISHNKTTLATANQLVGVTMSEPGVSRPVSVDVEQALSIAT